MEVSLAIYLVYSEEPESTCGYEISGVFGSLSDAISWAKSEGNGQMIFQSSLGPIDWKGMDANKNKTKWFD